MKPSMYRLSCLVFLLLIASAVPSPHCVLQAQGKVMDPPRATPIPAAAKVLLEKAEDFELLSLHPVQTKEKPKDNFHGWKVLGKTVVKEAASRKKLVDVFEKENTEFKRGLSDSDKERPATSFGPRHGIRVTHDGKTAAFVISFASYQTQVTVNGEKTETFLVSRSPTDVFDEVLKEGGVPLAQPPDYTAARIQKLEQTVAHLENQLRPHMGRAVTPNAMPIAIMAQTFGMMGFILGGGALALLVKLRKELKQLREEAKRPIDVPTESQGA